MIKFGKDNLQGVFWIQAFHLRIRLKSKLYETALKQKHVDWGILLDSQCGLYFDHYTLMKRVICTLTADYLFFDSGCKRLNHCFEPASHI